MVQQQEAIAILREFVADVDALAIMTRGDAAHVAAVDWPDLWLTYKKATALLQKIGEGA